MNSSKHAHDSAADSGRRIARTLFGFNRLLSIARAFDVAPTQNRA